MNVYKFDIGLKQTSKVSDDDADLVFSACCDDGTPAGAHNQVWIHFDREAASLEEAISSAVAQVQSAGLAVSKVELDVDAAISLGA